ncbi:RNA-directed DNA polymerase [Bacillus haynesii]|uniref:RNA-directed DNA polymerase n=1 Tax=Bacillus haynesii TaxID=1925021 RepID=UPI00228300CA|nr:RNA-directed DNA polymerase [Bacillus haynesii]MCY7816942.1 RNA-directed DNA polymerase [Bacillus haynesii]MCY8661892.1 RNA-directed DNA polymerase [Bacillus haynesii]MEC1457455.1 RNA-directed DNA polymerase [Bacillus haynesii]MEC1574270.1 RNA-directed DNA polymerase [Bacillus haynesii]
MLKLRMESLEWALKHIENHGDTDIFPVPFEYEAIRHIWDTRTKELPDGTTLKEYLRNQDMLQWKVRDYRRSLTPKHKYGFRQSTQLDPLDTLVYLALVYEIGHDIESKRIPVERNVSFSYRFNPNAEGRMFNSDINYGSFLNYCESKVNELIGDDNIKYIVVADIADFFPRLYLHPLENALSSCTTKTNHAKAIKRLLNNWNHSISYGIPVGQDASRLLAELALNDIDEGLLSEGVDFCRYVDDFRIFCSSEKEAYQQLALLAEMLFENHGLTLQQHKTRIVPVEEFRREFLKSKESVEVKRLSDEFQEILQELGIEDPYGEINYDSLPDDIQEEIDSLNLMAILKAQIDSESADSKIVGFVLRRMAQMQNTDSLDLVLENIDKLYTSFRHIFVYLNELELNELQQETVSKKLINILDDSIVGHLEYHRMWLFKTFSNGQGWNIDKLVTYYNEYFDDFSRRKIILALGQANQQYWFKTRKRSVMQYPSWQRRAFIAAARCLPGDEADHWYRSIMPRLDVLDVAVVKWAEGR